MVVITSIKYIAFCQGGAQHEDELQPHLTLIHSFLHLYHLFSFCIQLLFCIFAFIYFIVLFSPFKLFVYTSFAHSHHRTAQHSIHHFCSVFLLFFYYLFLRCHSPRRVLKAAVHGTHQCELATILYYVLF